MLGHHAQRLEHSLQTLEQKAALLAQFMDRVWQDSDSDEFALLPAHDMLDQLVRHAHSDAWCQSLQRGFLSAFVRHQPQYRLGSCVVASGSSRTALGILGFHCGIAEVVVPDLSWSYEQCFPTVHAVPLTQSLDLDVPAMIARVDALCRQDPAWCERGAVVICNPHNATGRIFREEDVRRLITHCLQHGIYVIDDLAYQNVAPVDDLPEIMTARQIAWDLVRAGTLSEDDANRVITVHSMSKTDCLAGARLAVVEIPDRRLRERFEQVNTHIRPNLAAIFICYLFYRNTTQTARSYWHLRNAIFRERTDALLAAAANLPPDRNPFGLTIIPPTGSMYPLLHVGHLPAGLSLDWLARPRWRGAASACCRWQPLPAQRRDLRPVARHSV